MKDNLKNRFHFYQKEIRKIINGWNLIPFAPISENDYLIQKILSHFISGNEEIQLYKIIESYLVGDLGLYSYEIDTQSKVEEMYIWWESK